MEVDKIDFKLGQKFESYEEFDTCFKNYKSKYNLTYILKNTKTLENCYYNKKKRNFVKEGYKKELKYYQARLKCSEPNCSSYIFIGAGDKDNLIIKSIELGHSHPLIEESLKNSTSNLNDACEEAIAPSSAFLGSSTLEKLTSLLMNSSSEELQEKLNSLNILISFWEKGIYPNITSSYNTDNSNVVNQNQLEAFKISNSTHENQCTPQQEQEVDALKPTSEAQFIIVDSTESFVDSSILNDSFNIFEVVEENFQKHDEGCNESNSAAVKIVVPVQEAQRAVPFSTLDDKSKVTRMLEWLSATEDLIRNIMSKKCSLSLENFDLDVENFNHAFLDQSVRNSMSLLTDFVDSQLLQLIENTIKEKLKKNIWFCKKCGNELTTRMIMCEACKSWMHFSCAQIKKAPKGDWFCQFCNP